MDSRFDLDRDEMLRLVHTLDEGVYITDQHRTILFWSRGAERITGWKAAEVMGRRCREGLLEHCDRHGRLLCKSDCPLAACLADGRPRTERLFLRHRDDRRLYVEIRTFPLDGPGQHPRGAVEVFRDLSQTNEVPPFLLPEA